MRGRPGQQLADAPPAWRAWALLAGYVTLVYAGLPYGPWIGRMVARTGFGSWLLGPGLPALAVVGALFLCVRTHRRGAPAWAPVVLVLAGLAYAVTFSWLRRWHLERTHLPEYGLAAFLAWRAVTPHVAGPVAAYGAAALLGAAIGVGDEVLQRFVPGRVYDVRDIAMNALGAFLGIIVLAAVRARRAPA